MPSFIDAASLGVLLLAIPIGLLLLYIVIKARYKKAGPDEALIVYGRKKVLGRGAVDEDGAPSGYRIVRGGGTFIWPGWEAYERLSLKIMTLELNLPHVYTEQGIPINVKAVAQVKVKGTTGAIRRAAGSFLGVDPKGVQSTIQETVAGHLRGIVGTLTVEQLYRDQKSFQEKIREEAHRDLDGMGFEFKSFVFQEIQDQQGYLDALGQPKIQEALKRARIATASADRDAAVEEEAARSGKEEKRIQVDTEIAEADKLLSLKQANIREEVDVAEAQATKAGEMELKEQDILIAAKEVERQKLELNATVRERAEADRYAVEQSAAADRKRREEEAAAEAAQRRDVGLAEAEAIEAKGTAEAEARRQLAEALKLYNEAGLSIEALKVLPDIAAAVSEPLSRGGSTTIISQGGNGTGTGASRLTEDVVQVLSQLGPIMQQLSGVDLDDFLRGVASLPGAAATNLRGSVDEKLHDSDEE